MIRQDQNAFHNLPINSYIFAVPLLYEKIIKNNQWSFFLIKHNSHLSSFGVLYYEKEKKILVILICAFFCQEQSVFVFFKFTTYFKNNCFLLCFVKSVYPKHLTFLLLFSWKVGGLILKIILCGEEDKGQRLV